jgi:hypothetical protein
MLALLNDPRQLVRNPRARSTWWWLGFSTGAFTIVALLCSIVYLVALLVSDGSITDPTGELGAAAILYVLALLLFWLFAVPATLALRSARPGLVLGLPTLLIGVYAATAIVLGGVGFIASQMSAGFSLLFGAGISMFLFGVFVAPPLLIVQLIILIVWFARRRRSPIAAPR